MYACERQKPVAFYQSVPVALPDAQVEVSPEPACVLWEFGQAGRGAQGDKGIPTGSAETSSSWVRVPVAWHEDTWAS